MWHKVNPLAFRIWYIKTWKSSWFADKKQFPEFLKLDAHVRVLLEDELKWIPLWNLIISRDQDAMTVNIYTAKTALVTWKSWENVQRLEKLLTVKFRHKFSINVKEVKKPELSANIVAFMVAQQIEKRMPYKRVLKQSISKTMEKWAKWIKIKVCWRLNGVDIARKETYKEWNIPAQTIRADIDYCSARSETIYWTIWVKVWIYKWDVFKKKK